MNGDLNVRVAQWIKIAKAAFITSEQLMFMHNAEFYMIEDIMRDGLILGLKTYVLTESLDTITKRTKVPLTWWDMFKETYQHKWWMFIRKPIKYRELVLQVEPRFLFPEYNRYPRDFGKPIRFVETTNVGWQEYVDS